MISLYFGLPGCGKTTLISKFAIEAIRGKKYKNVYCNIPLNIDGIIKIDENDLGKYQIENGLVIFDESTIAFDSRQFNKRSKAILDFFMLHRHYGCDILLMAQGWNTCDLRIRQITDRVYYVYKGKVLGKWWSKYWRIPYDILFPDPKRGNEGLGQIIQGYRKPPLINRIFAKTCFRPRYYRYFDSWDAPRLDELPSDRVYHPPITSLKTNPLATERDDKKVVPGAVSDSTKERRKATSLPIPATIGDGIMTNYLWYAMYLCG